MSSDQAVPKLDDVAKEAGVSPATVSRSLNSPGLVNQKTLDRVRSAVERLGYTPHFGARFMAAKRTFTIGAIIPTMENAIFARGIQAFQENLRAKGYTLLVSSSAYDPTIEAEQIRALASRGADGILLIGYERDKAIYEFLQMRGIPTLLAWAYSDQSPHTAIGFDNRASMYQLCDKVLEMGHRKIAVISGIVPGNDRAKNRLQGIVDRLNAQGFDTEKLPVIQTPYEIENGANAFEQLMSGSEKPTVVMCGNDVLAVGAMQRAHEMGLDVPGDISITGFDDIELARIASPKLTTVHVPHRDMGRRAAEELIRMVETKVSGASHELQSELRIRESLRALDTQ